MQDPQRPERLPGKSRQRLAGKTQPVALGRTNENTEMEREGDAWKVMLVERRQGVRSLALSWLRGPQGARGEQGHHCLLSGQLCLTEQSDIIFLDAVLGGFANSASEYLTGLSVTASKMGSTVPMQSTQKLKMHNTDH